MRFSSGAMTTTTSRVEPAGVVNTATSWAVVMRCSALRVGSPTAAGSAKVTPPSAARSQTASGGAVGVWDGSQCQTAFVLIQRLRRPPSGLRSELRATPA